MKPKAHLIFERPIVSEFSGDFKLLFNKYLINSEYYDWLLNFKWHIGTTGYAMVALSRNGKPLNVKMHRLVIDAKPGQIVDHINRNKLDNRIENLRFVTKSEKTVNSDRVDRAKYYCFDKARNRWRTQFVRFKLPNRQFKTEIEVQEYVKQILIGKR